METGGGPRLRSPGEEHSPDGGAEPRGASGERSLKRRPELGSELSCPEAFQRGEAPSLGPSSSRMGGSVPGEPLHRGGHEHQDGCASRSPSWRLLDRDTERKRRKPPGSKPDGRALRHQP